MKSQDFSERDYYLLNLALSELLIETILNDDNQNSNEFGGNYTNNKNKKEIKS